MKKCLEVERNNQTCCICVFRDVLHHLKINIEVENDGFGSDTLPETDSLTLKTDGWKMIRLPFGAFGLIFRGELLNFQGVRFRYITT